MILFGGFVPDATTPAAAAAEGIAFLHCSAWLDYGVFQNDTWYFATPSKSSTHRYWQRVATQGPTPPARAHHTLTAIGLAQLLFGGLGEAHGTASGQPQSARTAAGCPSCAAFGDLWRLEDNTWRQLNATGPQPPARFSHSAAGVALGSTGADHSLVVYGGRSSSSGAGGAVARDDLWVYDILRGSWREVVGEPQPLARFAHAAAVTSAGRSMVIHGGHGTGKPAPRMFLTPSLLPCWQREAGAIDTCMFFPWRCIVHAALPGGSAPSPYHRGS